MFSRFERLISPYPEQAPPRLPRGLLPFVWACTQGLRGYVAVIIVLVAAVGMFEAFLFGMLGHVVDWLGSLPPQRLWLDEGGTLLLLAGALVASIGVVTVWCLVKYQAISSNFPMLLRWNFHRLMLDQSIAFYQDEFAGRISTKVMQTALAVRDTVMIICDILVFVVIYFVTMVLLVGGFDALLLLPFLGWLVLYVSALRWFVPRLGRVAQQQADARSLMTGRITDAYTNIATVKLFSHARREAAFARGAMQEFMGTAYTQFRLVTGVEVVNHALSMGLILGTTGLTLWLWTQGRVGVGAVAAATAMALRLNGISHWVMWEMASLFEHIGTVQDGIGTLSRPRLVQDSADAVPLAVTR
ncbi:MAG TPA: ABC transporter transmembrane domain-containing protein, partial [Burkholderiaceae bacterium]|nr:ABC transporter transmembrane domain-containing protein [Burkholderiaceae bacterium]